MQGSLAPCKQYVFACFGVLPALSFLLTLQLPHNREERGGVALSLSHSLTRTLSLPPCSLTRPSLAASQDGVHKFGGFEVEVVDPVADYLATLQEVFDFGLLKGFVSRPDFSMVFDAMHAVTGEPARLRTRVHLAAVCARVRSCSL